jgi:putative NIF3 family GTP cyclohydrolase 1 type 2
MLALRAAGISALCLGHGRSEKPALRMLRDKLAERFPSLEVQLSSADVAPYQWV